MTSQAVKDLMVDAVTKILACKHDKGIITFAIEVEWCLECGAVATFIDGERSWLRSRSHNTLSILRGHL